MKIKDIVKQESQKLKFVTHIPAKEVEILICHIMNKNTIWLHLNYDKEFDKEKELIKLVEKRAGNFPLEYIINKASFYGENFIVKENVLIPRPETEILVDKAVDILKQQKSKTKVLEIGTGSGIISVMLALLIDDIEIVAVDINKDAIALAKENAKKHNVEKKIDFRLSNLYENIEDKDVFMTISNPPYIANSYKLPKNVEFEPGNALFGGDIGDELLKKIIEETYKKDITYLLCEMGYDQKESLSKFFKSLKLNDFEFYKDYEDFDRGFTLKLK